MRYLKDIVTATVGWFRLPATDNPQMASDNDAQFLSSLDSIGPNPTSTQIPSGPIKPHQGPLCPKLQLWLRVVSVDLRQIRSWAPDHPANMALKMLWGRRTSLETLQKALIIERFFAGVGEKAKWRLYLAMSRVVLRDYKEQSRRHRLERRKTMQEMPPQPKPMKSRRRIYNRWLKIPSPSVLVGVPPVPHVAA